MQTIESRTSIMPPLQRVVSTGVDTSSPVTIDTARERRFRHAWQSLIDDKLLSWLKDPHQLADDGVESPSDRMLRLAIDYAEKFRDDGLPPPDSIVLDPNGGIVFERRCDEATEVFHFWSNGILEYQRFRGTKLVERYTH